MKRLPVTSIFIGGDRDEGGGSLCLLAGAQQLDNDAAEGAGAVLPRRLYVEVADSERLVERFVVMLRLRSVIFICPVSINYLLN